MKPITYLSKNAVSAKDPLLTFVELIAIEVVNIGLCSLDLELTRFSLVVQRPIIKSYVLHD